MATILRTGSQPKVILNGHPKKQKMQSKRTILNDIKTCLKQMNQLKKKHCIHIII